MPDLVVIPLMPGPMTDNLETSVAVEGHKPWGFNKYLSTMKGVRPGVNVAFVRSTLPNGRPIGKQGPYPSDAVVDRVVLGMVVKCVQEATSPYFDGYPHGFWYDLIDDVRFEEPADLSTAAMTFNEALPGLGLDAPKFVELLSNARSAKIGMYFDGLPRKADYFKAFDSNKARTEPRTRASAQRVGGDVAHSADDQLHAAVDDFVAAVVSAGLVFKGINEHLPRAFAAALIAKRFVLLTGLAGSGKTQLARAFGQWLGAGGKDDRRLVVPVRADWTTPEPLLGYEDALLPPDPNGRRAWTVPRALEFMLQAHHDPESLYVIVLDEMNLAHVERYFADVLSGMESTEPILPNLRRDGSGYWYMVTSDEPLLPLPTNLFIIGTVNIDETTYQFSPKVLDRSFSFEFRVSTDELDRSLRALTVAPAASEAHIASMRDAAANPNWHIDHPAEGSSEIEALLLDLHGKLSSVGLEFGHRSYREALRMSALLSTVGVDDFADVADWVVMSKVLPRVHGSRRQLEPFLRQLHAVAAGDDPDKPMFPLIARKTSRMIESLVSNQYVSFAE